MDISVHICIKTPDGSILYITQPTGKAKAKHALIDRQLIKVRDREGKFASSHRWAGKPIYLL